MPSADFQLDGLVIRSVVSGENDRLVTILTASRGRLTFMAKGARSLRNSNMPACNPYVYGTYVLHAKGGALWLREATLSEGFSGIGKDIAAIYLAQYISDVSYELSDPELPAEELLRLMLNSFYAISNKIKSLPQIKAVFELRAAAMSGYEPELSCCRMCGRADADLYYLDVMNGGLLCPDCAQNAPKLPVDAPYGSVPVDEFMTRSILMPLSAGALASARYVLESDMKRMLSFELSDARDLSMLSRAAESYLLSHLERGFNVLKTYYEVLK